MVSAVKTRPNYYEVLGIAPTASGDEVAAAFARELTRPRAFGGIAEVSIAYQALRYPGRRAAYDASLGLKPAAAERRDTDRSPLPARHEDSQSPPQPGAEPPIASFIASSLRQPVEPDLRRDPTPGFRSQPVEAPAKPAVAQHAGDRAVGRVHLEFVGDRKSSPIPWRSIGAAGAVIAAIGLLAAWAGSNATHPSEPQQPGRTVTVALPQPTPPPQATIAPAPTRVEAQPERRTPAAVAVARLERVPLAQSPRVLADQQPQAPLPEPGEVNADTNAQAAAQPVPIAADAAHLPLPNAVIARTIGRIGYACGQVAATATIEGAAPGVFKVTCTSGQSYRATRVGGRYRFKRLGNQ